MSIDLKDRFKCAIKAYRDGDLELAKALFVEILSEDPANPQALTSLGAIYRKKGSYSLAISSLRSAIEASSRYLGAYMNLALVYSDLEDFKKAIACYNEALKISPNSAFIYNQVAILVEKMGKLDQAIDLYKEAIKKDVKFVNAYNNIGVILYKQKRYKEAVEIFKLSLGVDDKFVSTYVNIGAACNKAGFYEEGRDYLLKATNLDQSNSGAFGNLGNIYNKLKEHKLALKAHKKALELDDSSAINYANIGITYKNLARYKEAKKALKRAIKIDENFTNAHFDLATTHLILGEYKEGFREYEWRFKKDEMRTILHDLGDVLNRPKFTLKSAKKGKTLLLWSEQGFGDMIQFARFAKELKSRYKELKLKVEVRSELVDLFRDQEYFDEVIARGESKGEFDYQLALMSLPHLLKTTAKNLPTYEGYIELKDSEFDIEIDDKKLNIGVVWSASVTSESYEGRVFGLKYYESLMRDKDIKLFSLQVGDSGDIKNYTTKEIIDLEPKLTSFKESFKAIDKLDLVITSDTSVAHLAGAMGKKCFVMLQKDAEWRWGLDSKKSIWYPNTTLIRQSKQGDWDSAFKKLKKELERIK